MMPTEVIKHCLMEHHIMSVLGMVPITRSQHEQLDVFPLSVHV
jgi:hypothetical protein